MKRNRVLAEQRRQQLLQQVKEDGAVVTSEIAHDFGVSEMTIRNDLAVLASEGHLERIHGGAVARRWLSIEPSYTEKAKLQLDEKQAIGREAARMIEDGMVVFIGNGTTTMEIIRNLPSDRRIRAFTNSLNHADDLARRPNVDLNILGGHVRSVSLAMVGPLVHRALESVYFDIAFLGVNGFSLEYGLSVPSLNEAQVVAQIMEQSSRAVVVIDHTKLGQMTHGKIADVTSVDTLVIDKIPDPAMAEKLRRLGIEIRYAEARRR
jgi:DeoR/GlpR family transcriptional regulator of sugar metabolism